MVSSLHLLAATTSDIGHGCASTTTSLSYLQRCSNVKGLKGASDLFLVIISEAARSGGFFFPSVPLSTLLLRIRGS
ncbi:hypothetical protein SETIT_9G433900v2 [Setaria italica]|uniref:Uncharacterized protein n=1 Tax=Setaria italica TaxID=4555 RepID=A0A368SRZ3_SETIT|nr:hypothetical protein SETIT_9G433900v2 [Setaria italica]